MKWIKSKFQGVRYREHATRKHGFLPDRYYTIFYKLNGKMVQEALGWASESWEEERGGQKRLVNWTEKRASAVLAELQKNQSIGTGPRTLREKRALLQEANDAQRAQGITVAEFWDEDYRHILTSRIKSSSSRKEITHFEKRVRPTLGNKPLNALVHQDVEQIVHQMKNEGLSPRTQEYAVGTIFRIWKHAAKRKIVKAGDNPAAGIQIERVNNTRTRVLTPKEWNDILAYLAKSDPDAHDITLFCGLVGCRFSEAAQLTSEHVDLTRQTVLFVDTKNRDSREIYLAPELLPLLERRKSGKAGDFVFTKRDGSAYREAPSAFKTAVEKLELNKNRGPRDRVSLHSLRHTAATLTARNQTPVKDMQLLFGWKTPSMVFRYVKGDKESQKNAMTGLAKALSNNTSQLLEQSE